MHVKFMVLITRQITIPLFIKIEENILSKTGKILEENNFKYKNPLFLYDRREFFILSKKIFKKLLKNHLEIFENTQENVRRVVKIISKNNIDVIFSCGGGRVLDVGKLTAAKSKINFISVPTGPSNDGIASPIAVIKNDRGLSESLGAQMPMGIIVDLNLVKKAPKRNIQSGIGDLLSNFSAISDWQLSNKYTGEKIDDFAQSLAYTAADFVFGICLHNHKINIHNADFLKNMINGLILSGIAMGIAGSSRPCSGAEHMISHAIDALYGGKAMHGEQVAIGTVIAERIRGGDYKKYINIFKKLGVMRDWRDLNLTRDEMIRAILFAPKTRAGRYSILSHKKLTKKYLAKILEY